MATLTDAIRGRTVESDQSGMICLFRLGVTHIELRNLERALEVCSQVVELDPQNATPHYNLAGVYALSGRPADAFMELKKDVDLGDPDWGYLEDDPWFESLRSDPRFAEVIDRMKRSSPTDPGTP